MFRLTPDIEALVDAVRESRVYYAKQYTNPGYVYNMPMWWIVPAVKEVRHEFRVGLSEAHYVVLAYIYKRTSEGDDETAPRWAQMEEATKWRVMALVFDDEGPTADAG